MLAICCVACVSRRLWDEVFANYHKRGIPVSRAVVVDRVAKLQARGKVKDFTKSQIDGTPLEKDVLRHAPPEDHHVVQLALAASARWIFTDDGPLRDSASRFRLAQPLRVELPAWVLDEIAEPEAPCS